MSLVKTTGEKTEVIPMAMGEKMATQKPILRTDNMFEVRLKFSPEVNYTFSETLRDNFQLEKYSIQTVRRCVICNEVFIYSAFSNKQFICGSCIKEHEYQKCSNCNSMIVNGSMLKNSEGKIKWFCQDCKQRNFLYCSFCSTHKSKGFFSVYRGDHICSECVSDKNLKACYDCGELYEVREMDHTSKDRFCLHCALSRKLQAKTKRILLSSHKPSEMVFLSTNQEDKEYLGIELEFQWSSSENRIKILTFLEKYEDHYLKEDGSVSSGCEIVTFPATKDYHIKRFKGILQTMNDLECISHDSGDCGLHIHISRQAFGANTRTQSKNIAKMLYLIEHFRSEVKKFSRREQKCHNAHGESWNNSAPYRYCEFYNLDYSDGKVTRAYQKAVYQNKIKIRRSRYGDETIRSGRYKVLNFQNKDTVEFRILRGTLNYKTFVSALEFTCLMVKIAKNTSEKDILKLEWNDIVKEAITTPILFEQFKKLNLVR
jgi:hypothetical protein